MSDRGLTHTSRTSMRVEGGRRVPCAAPFYPHRGSYCDKRRRLVCGPLSPILSFRGNASTESIIAEVEADPLRLMFEGAIPHRTSSGPIYRTRQECIAVAREMGVGVFVKQRDIMGGVGDLIIVSTWANIISSGAETRMGPLSKVPGWNMCLYNSIHYNRVPAAHYFPTIDRLPT